MFFSPALVSTLVAGAEASDASWNVLVSQGLFVGYPKAFQEGPPVSLPRWQSLPMFPHY